MPLAAFASRLLEVLLGRHHWKILLVLHSVPTLKTELILLSMIATCLLTVLAEAVEVSAVVVSAPKGPDDAMDLVQVFLVAAHMPALAVQAYSEA